MHGSQSNLSDFHMHFSISPQAFEHSPMATREDPSAHTTPNNAAAMTPPIFIDTPTLRSLLSYKTLIHHLQTSLPSASSTIQSPIRQSHQTSPSSSLLLMPSWSLSSSLPYIGVKLVTHHPHNSTLNLPAVHATYALFNSLTGQPLASMDGTELTLHRTSCVSALASMYLARPESQTLLMIGAGSLAPHLIRAHLTAIPTIKKVIIWNRTLDKARKLAQTMSSDDQLKGLCFESNGCLEEVVGAADIVSCATNSETPLVNGADLKAGTHLDLVGSFQHSMRECDDEAIRRGRVFVDNAAAMEEAGELVGAFERGVISREEIGGCLVELIRGEKVGRREDSEITVFKSVGSAVVDVVSAQLVYETYMKNDQSH
ncbi:protein SAR DEFICIENT 4 [Cornus florida]|uniref:protein SAR DEFICIENT 4 n=1 Tax=Cornus florida TaxID=4283 RepID=UPI0028A16650|nr:protein SAR DEFICIENT 4 [Cornus florida]